MENLEIIRKRLQDQEVLNSFKKDFEAQQKKALSLQKKLDKIKEEMLYTQRIIKQIEGRK